MIEGKRIKLEEENKKIKKKSNQCLKKYMQMNFYINKQEK